MKRYALSSMSTTWTPPSLEGTGKTFTLREPTSGEMDRLAAALFERGCVPVEQATLRAVLIDEIYRHYPEAEADEYAGACEESWNAEMEHANRLGIWMEQERERQIDIRKGAPEYPSAEYPKAGVSIRIQSKAQLARDEMNQKSARFRALTMQHLGYEAEQKDWTMRLYLLGWSGFATPVEKDESGEAITEAAFDALCTELGKDPVRELYHQINASFALTLEEVGNFDLPAKSDAGLIPSPAPSEDLESSAGSLTASNIEPTPAGELDLPREPSSTST